MQQGRISLRLAALLCAVLGLAGCTLSDSQKHDDIWSVWTRIDKSASATVFFATDRQRDAGAPFGMGLHWGSAMTCGRSVVSNFAPTAATPPEIMPCQGADAVEGQQIGGPAFAMSGFAAAVADEAHRRGCASMLLYVHGFNTTFRTALLHTGQLSADVAWPCATALLSWSSEGQADRYAADLERSAYAVPGLINLLRDVADKGVRENVLAYSMGAHITLTAIATLGSYCESRGTKIVQELILVAPDVNAEHDNDDFGRLLERAAPCVERTTIYASDNDVVLVASEGFHGGVPRAGRIPNPDLQYRACARANVDVIDASLAPGDDFGHGYFINSYEMMRDFRAVLAHQPLASRVAATLTPPVAASLACPDGTRASAERYVLAVDPSRRPSWSRRFLRHVVPLIVPVQ